MKFYEWLASEGVVIARVAETTGLDRTYLWKLAKGLRRPSHAAILKICAASGGALTPADFFSDANPPLRPFQRSRKKAA